MSSDLRETPAEVGDLVQVRTDGRSAAAQKYAGEQGRVTMVLSGPSRTIIDVRIHNNFDTVFEERDLLIKATKGS